MIPELRKQYNTEFTDARYVAYKHELNTTYQYPVDFRIAETPIFLSRAFTSDLYKASQEIIDGIETEAFRQHSKNAIPAGSSVPNEDDATTFLQLDFALALNDSGEIVPRLIELQGFPSLYCYQVFQDKTMRKHFSMPEGLSTFFSGFEEEKYIKMMREIIVGDEDPENVILLEIEPEKQKTRIDFACTEAMLGVRPVSVTNIIKRNRSLFYLHDGKEILIKRIYNRTIFDELQKKNFSLNFSFSDELDVTWVGHPNWFFKISKYSLPFLKSSYSPEAWFLSDLKEYPQDLNNYVLKPLYSFAGAGVEIDVTKEILDSIKEKKNYILQKKITYSPAIETPDGFAKAEIRLMFVRWKEKLTLVNNLVRLSKGKMLGVDFNKDKTWVGSSLAYHY